MDLVQGHTIMLLGIHINRAITFMVDLAWMSMVVVQEEYGTEQLTLVEFLR